MKTVFNVLVLGGQIIIILALIEIKVIGKAIRKQLRGLA